MEQEIKKLMADMKDSIALGKSLKECVDTMLAWGAENGRLGETEKAIKELRDDHAVLVKDLGKRLDRAERQAFNGRGNYRGKFASADQARAFGLLAVSTILGKQWAIDALKGEYPDTAKAFTSGDADALIPDQFDGVLVDLIERYGVFERNARRMPMATSVISYPKKSARTTAAAIAEGAAATETKPVVGNNQLTARKWFAYTEIPKEVAEDSLIPVAEFLAEDMAMAHAQAADQAGFTGDGTGGFNSITGVTNALGTAAIVTGSGNAWNLLTLEDFEKAVSLPVQHASVDARWYCSRQFFWQVMVKLMLGSGGVTAGEIEGRRRLLFLDTPVELTQVLPIASAVSQIGAVYGSLRQGAMFGDRRQLTIGQSEHFKFSSDVISVLATRRYDINIHGGGDASIVESLSAVKTSAV